MTDTVGADKVKQTDKVLLTSVTQKYKLAKGYNHVIKSISSGGVTYEEGIDYRIETDKTGNSFIVWTFLEGDTGRGIGPWGWFFPEGGDFQNKMLFPNGDLPTGFGWAFDSGTGDVIITNEGLKDYGQSSHVGALPPYTRTEYTNNMRFGTGDFPISAAPVPPGKFTALVRPAYRTGIVSSEQLGLGVFYGEALILYGTPCDFIGIGGYDSGCVDACPSPAGSGGALTNTNSFEGSARIYKGTSGSNSPTLKVFRVQSTLDGIDVTATNVANSGGNIRVTTSAPHGYNIGDIVYMVDGLGTYVSQSGNVIYLDKEGFRVTAVPGANTFEIDAPDPSIFSWTFGAPWPTIQKVSSCSAEYWDSGLVFPDHDIRFVATQTGDFGGSLVYSFFYNMTGLEKDWKKLGPSMSAPLGYSAPSGKAIVGSYMGGHFNLYGSAGTFSSNNYEDGTNHMTVWRKVESETPFYTFPRTPTYKTIPIFDEESG